MLPTILAIILVVFVLWRLGWRYTLGGVGVIVLVGVLMYLDPPQSSFDACVIEGTGPMRRYHDQEEAVRRSTMACEAAFAIERERLSRAR